MGEGALDSFDGLKKVLVKRQMIIKDSLFLKVGKPAFMKEATFSSIAQRKKNEWILTIYYQPKDRGKVERAFSSLTVDITGCEQLPVDTDSPSEEEQNFMFMM